MCQQCALELLARDDAIRQQLADVLGYATYHTKSSWCCDGSLYIGVEITDLERLLTREKAEDRDGKSRTSPRPLRGWKRGEEPDIFSGPVREVL